ncbi:MAG: uncharacterized protein KVP18_002261 [Porospora cf. gigantea A]|nr:MAG: hypothetical protein KVP18_002261 [Porospora cf. gigantea A]
MTGTIFGYELGGSGGILLLKSFQEDFGSGLDDAPYENQNTALLALFAIGGVFGTMPSPYVSDTFGRKTSLAIFAVSAMVGSALDMVAPAGKIGFLWLGRFLVGTAIGGVTVVGPCYISELCPANNRGRVSCMWQLGVTLGILAAGVVNLVVEYTSNSWRVAYSGTGVIGVAILAGLRQSVESPRWLMLRGKECEARDVLGLFLPPAEVEAEIVNMHAELITFGVGLPSRWELVMFHHGMSVRNRAIVFFMALFQQLSGMNAIVYYAPMMFHNDDHNLKLNAIIQAVNLASTFLCFCIVDHLGRRVTIFAGAAVMLASWGTLGILFGIGMQSMWSTFCICLLFVFAFAWSWGPLMWIYGPEMFPTRHRSQGMAVMATSHWLWNTLLSRATPFMISSRIASIIGITIFSISISIGSVLCYCYLPETTGQSLEMLVRQSSDGTDFMLIPRSGDTHI